MSQSNKVTQIKESLVEKKRPQCNLNLWRNRNFLTDILQLWQTPYISFSTKVDQVTVEDLQLLRDHERAKNLYPKMRPTNFESITAKQVRSKINRMVWGGIFWYGGQLFICEVSSIISIYVFKLIIDHLAAGGEDQTYSIQLFVTFALLRFTAMISRGYYDLHVYNYYKFVTTQVQCLLFEFVCNLPQWQIGTENTSLLINIICKDVECFVDGSWAYPYLIMVPVNTILSAFILHSMFGWKIVVCYGGMMILLAIQLIANKVNAGILLRKNGLTDQRLEQLRQVLYGIRQIKVRCLEPIFQEQIRKKRAQELSVFSKYCDIRIITSSLYFNSGIILSTILFLMVDRNLLALGKVFSTLSLLGYIFNFSILFSNYAIEALQCLNIFFDRMEMAITKPFEESQKMNKAVEIKKDGCLEYSDVSVSWHKTANDQNILSGVNFKFQPGDRVGIVGRVGSGKTSLLLSILGELRTTKGSIKHSGKVSFAEQTPLIVTGTVQSNITFGLPFEPERYDRVIEACCLKEDFQNLSNGDRTKVGEMGQILSGGQRSRIALARALYRKDSQIIMLDGTLSSLDARVSRQILNNLLHGEFTRNKILLLVSYDLDQAREMDYILNVTDHKSVNVMSKQDFQQNQASIHLEAPSANLNDDKEDTEKQVVQDEINYRGQVSWKDFKIFFGYSFGGLCGVFLIILLHFLIHGTSVLVSVYLGLTLTARFSHSDNPDEDDGNTQFIKILSTLIILAILTNSIGKLISNRIFISISRRMHEKMVDAQIHAPVSYHEQNTTGLILNRFTADVCELDHFLFKFLEMIDYSVKLTFSFIIVFYLYPALILLAILQMFYLWSLRYKTVCATADVIRLKFSLISPINSIIQDAMNGLPTLKCMDQIHFYLRTLFKVMDTQSRAHVISNSANRWIAFRLDIQAELLSTSFAFLSIFLASVTNTEKVAIIAIGFQQAIDVTRFFNSSIRWSVEVESAMVSIQRLQQLADAEPEETLVQKQQTTQQLISKGEIKFEDVEMRYKPELDPALQNLTFTVKPGEKIAIVGRTGAGKSSIFQLLFRFRDANKGCVKLDDKNINTYCRTALREQLNVVLQQPFVLTNQTVRENLDIKGEVPDKVLQESLVESSLVYNQESDHKIDLDTKASILSTGQVQLLALTQSLINFKLNRSKVLLMDEPTSQIDEKSQQQILDALLREATRVQASMIMIAHKLETAVKYSDKILVMEQGSVAQFDTAYNLLRPVENKVTADGIFAQMVQSLNPQQQERIFDLLKQQ